MMVLYLQLKNQESNTSIIGLVLFQILPSGEDRPESLEVQTNAEIVNETENIERMEGEGVEEDELLNRDEKSTLILLFQL